MVALPTSQDDEIIQEFLDNFYQLVTPNTQDTEKVVSYLESLFNLSQNVYIRKEALKHVCELALVSINGADFKALGLLFSISSSEDIFIISCSIKYLFLFYHRQLPNNDAKLVDRIKLFQNHLSAHVSSEVFYRLGLISLSQINDQQSDIQVSVVLSEALMHFKSAQSEEENRIDAHFFQAVITLYQAIYKKDLTEFNYRYKEIEEVLKEKEMYSLHENDYELEFYVHSLMIRVKNTFLIAVESDVWLEPLKAIDSLKSAFLELEALNSANIGFRASYSIFKQQLIRRMLDVIYLSNLAGKLPLLSKVEQTENSPTLSSFIKYIFKKIGNDPNSQVDFKLIQHISDLAGAESIEEIYLSIEDINDKNEVLQKIKPYLEKATRGQLDCYTGYPQGQDIYFNLVKQISTSLPGYDGGRLKHFSRLLEEIIRYTYHTHVGFERGDFNFLYSKSCKGLGEDASESNLQDSMYSYLKGSRIAYAFESEKSKVTQGGRVDIIYENERVTFPIELKKTNTKQSLDEIKINYISQAQTYTSGYDQLGCFVLLDLSEKTTIEPTPNIKDWFNLIHLNTGTTRPTNHPDYVVCIVIPGNKLLPSAMSNYGK